ncbi:methyltransferase domain-containing protein [Ginsengibacter hankyongi]|uniref:Methyltransferase domain-containing protein n=1 Tax=Ginsengibacter hankyongi TaxID=2607284 RepID=A0A5J5IKS3_9BACT|nr:class I SAM-dependent methyltransferase [Ginsengibacter hankyongi]KAA9040973.1 methyltransferase domain-containing protein [Ginsengibacter hankyongi]
MNIQQAYNNWASHYDTNHNKTRDLEAIAFREMLSGISFDSVLEVGCGTGKNTTWLMEKAKHVMAVDLSEEMLAKAKEKIKSDHVDFIQTDIKNEWTFTNQLYDLVSFSLVLEHIQNLDPVFNEVSKKLIPGGYVYIGELHPFKQYAGTKARFDTEDGQQVVECFNHHISEFIQTAKKYQLMPVDILEYFDENDTSEIPRILSILLQQKATGI